MDKVFLQDYIRYGLELAEYHLLESYDGVKDKTDETDRVFLESVQVSFLFAFSLSRFPVFFFLATNGAAISQQCLIKYWLSLCCSCLHCIVLICIILLEHCPDVFLIFALGSFIKKYCP